MTASCFYDVILMDFNLTDRTGIEVIKDIRRFNQESQILMMTGHASLDTAVKAIQESVYDFLIKPVDVNNLKRGIKKALEKLTLEQDVKKLVEELKDKNNELSHLNEMKSKFLSMTPSAAAPKQTARRINCWLNWTVFPTPGRISSL